MQRNNKTCAIIGMQPNRLPSDLDQSSLLARLDAALRRSFFQGYTTFLTGMAMGVDVWAGDIILKLRAEFPHVRLICYLPCETQANKWPSGWREKYFNILANANDVIYLQTHYTNGCMQRRSRNMVDDSSLLIAVHASAAIGGTAQTIHYASAQGLKIVIINPFDCLQTAQPLLQSRLISQY